MWSDPLPDKAVTNPTEFFNKECDGPSLRSVIFTSERVIDAINKLDGEASVETRWKEFKGNIPFNMRTVHAYLPSSYYLPSPTYLLFP